LASGARFALRRRAGEGGSAEVWLAHDLVRGGEVALKLARDEQGRAALAREAAHAALAASPRLPELVEVGWARIDAGTAFQVDAQPGARAFIALRWVDGAPPAAGASDDDRRRLALCIARDVGEALSELHALGLAHGDVTPQNLVVDRRGRVHLLDLGLAAGAYSLDVEGGTPRYLARGDAELGDGRARDLAALGAVVAEVVEDDVARAESPITAARARSLGGSLGAIATALLAPSPSARPSAAWASEMAREALEALAQARPRAGDAEREEVELRRRRIRATYLRLRRDDIDAASSARAGTAPWLAEAVALRRRAKAIRPGDRAASEPLELGALEPDRVASWLAALVGPAVAAWPLDTISGAGEAELAGALSTLAARLAPEAWTLADVEDALGAREAPLGSPMAATRARASTRAASTAEATGDAWTAERAAATALGLAAIPVDREAIRAVEGSEAAPAQLVLAAAEALRRLGEHGRAQALVLRPAARAWPGAGALAADVLRRAGDPRRAGELAREALVSDPGGRARAVLARLAFDEGRLDDVEELTREARDAAPCEVAALAASARGDPARALGLLARGEAVARSAEERARLAGVRGYVLHASDPARSRDAYASAVEDAVRSGAVVEEATYRMGEAAAAADLGDLGRSIETARRAALLWDHLGRPALAARAELARAAAHATAGAAHEATRAAAVAIARAREGGDVRAEAYAWWAVADVHGAASKDAAAAALRAAVALTELGSGRLRRAVERATNGADEDGAGASATSVTGRPELTEDEVRAAARLVRHVPGGLDVELVGELDERAAAGGSLGVAARLEWLGARAAAILEEPPAPPGIGAAALLAALASLVDARAPVGSRGPALAAGHALAARLGRGELAQRLLGALGDAARDLVRRAGPELAPAVRALPWVARAGARPEAALQPEQARDLEALVRSLGDRERLRPLLDRVVDALVLWTGVERGLLLLRAPDGRLVARAARNLARADLRGEQLALSQTLAHRALEAREPVVAVDAAGELPSVHQSVHALKLRSVLAVPLLARGEPLGVVYLDDRARRGAFGERELSWTRTIAALAALAIADARDQVLLRRAARRAERASARLADTLARREAALDVAERELARARDRRETRFSYEGIVGESEAVHAMLRLVDRVTASDVPVMLFGESGSGKELVARAIHANGPRAGRPFVGENCSAIPEGLLESALFGHVRGAFTGADRPRSGLFEVADGGTLFLDEIGEMSLAMQAKLLRVLEDGLVRPVGSERARKVDVRVVTATHRDLAEMVRARTFREDLLYRLSVITIPIPALRERAGDVPLLVRHFLDKHARGAPIRITRAAMERLGAYPWPGNVRQLENEIRRSIVLSDGTIDREHLSKEVDAGGAGRPPALGLEVRSRVDALEADLVREAMRRTQGNQTQAAKLLGLSRFGLQKMIKRLALD
jgi:transcriptional regulator with GAF, ATPase, and Fis domain